MDLNHRYTPKLAKQEICSRVSPPSGAKLGTSTSESAKNRFENLLHRKVSIYPQNNLYEVDFQFRVSKKCCFLTQNFCRNDLNLPKNQFFHLQEFYKSLDFAFNNFFLSTYTPGGSKKTI